MHTLDLVILKGKLQPSLTEMHFLTLRLQKCHWVETLRLSFLNIAVENSGKSPPSIGKSSTSGP